MAWAPPHGMRRVITSWGHEEGHHLMAWAPPHGMRRVITSWLAHRLALAHSSHSPTAPPPLHIAQAVAASLRMLGTDYLDLLMLHSVGPSVTARQEAWRAMEDLQIRGVVKSLGVSNFGSHDLEVSWRPRHLCHTRVA